MVALLFGSFLGGIEKGGLKVNRNPRKDGTARRKNPEDSSAKWQQAIEKYEAFHWGEEPRRAKRKKIAPPPVYGFELGTLHAITYETSKGGEKALWEHEFGEEGGRKPRLVADSETNKLHIVGGDYDVRPEGIVD